MVAPSAVVLAGLIWWLEAQASSGRETLFALLQPVTLANCTLERFGEPNDGGYLVCANLLDTVQVGYSYGISGYDQWGCDVSRKLSVRVHQYDCFDTRPTSCNHGDLVFHAECVGASSSVIDGRPFDTIANQISKNGDAGKGVVLKIDVEGAEWESFPATPDETLQRIDQLVVEFHGVADPRILPVVERLRQHFHVAHVHFNNNRCRPGVEPFPADVYEVLFVNKRIGVVAGSKAMQPHQLDAPNRPAIPDCQMSDRQSG
ncbi:MAG: hypothetical protein ACRD3C_19055 [Vicinamibacterales bacterium]